jgi:glycosyltransferase involved in cell wall biosynthesis
VGRVSPVKGVDILAEGFLQVPGEDLRLKIYGVRAEDESLAPLNNKLRSFAQRDTRIELYPMLSLPDVLRAYQDLDLVAIPSVTLETGPLVLFEAHQLGVPVFGSGRLGHPKLVEVGGMVVDPNSPEGWRDALGIAAGEFRTGAWHERVARLRTAPKLKTMGDVAREMCGLYQAVTE